MADNNAIVTPEGGQTPPVPQSTGEVPPVEGAAPAESTPPVEGAAPVEPAAPVEAKPVVPPSLLNRIDELSRKNHDKDREINELRARIEAAKPPEQRQTLTEQDVEQRAAQLAARRVFDQECSKVYESGKAAYPDFQNSVDMIQRLAGQAIIPLVETALEMGDAHKTLYELGKNADELVRIASLPVTRQAAAIAKFSASIATKPQISKAPAPITPRVGGGTKAAPAEVDLYNDETPTPDWMAARKKALESRGRRA